MSISSCPSCGKQVTLPTGVGTAAKVRCPLCHSQYTLADALVNMPPLLELVDELESELDEDGLGGLDTVATVEFMPELVDELESAKEAAAKLADLDLEAPVDLEATVDLEALGEQDDLTVQDQDTEIEELSFNADDELPGDELPDLAGAELVADSPEVAFHLEDDLTAAAEPAPLADLGEGAEEVAFDFDEADPTKATIDINDMAFDMPDAEPLGARTLGGGSLGDEPTIDFGEAAEEDATIGFPEPAADLESTIDFDEPVEAAAGDDEISLDFGAPLDEDSAAMPLVTPSDAPAEEDADDGKGKKKKKKKEKKVKAPKAPREPGEKRRMSTMLSAILGAVIALPIALYGMLWVGGKDFDFVGLGNYLPGAVLPGSFSKSRVIAAKPTMSQTLPTGGADTPPSLPSEPAADAPTATPEPAADAPAEPAADAPAEPAADAPPAEPAPEPAPNDAAPADATPSDTTPAEPAPAEPAPADDTPAAPAPEEPSLDPITTDKPAGDLPAEMPDEKPAAGDPVEDLLAPSADDKPKEEPAAEAPESDPVADLLPSDEKPTDKPAEEMPADEAIADDTPSEPVGPAAATEFALADVAAAAQQAAAADQRILAAQSSGDEAEQKKARSNFYLSIFRLAETVTFAKDDAQQLAQLRGGIQQTLEQFAADSKRVDALKFNAARWLGFAKRTTPGVVLAGTVESAERVGKLYEVKVGIGLDSSAPVVTVLSGTDPGLAAGDAAFVLGTIVDDPAENLAGYDGNEPQVVWSGMAVKSASAK